MAKNPYPSELADRFQVRMPDGLRDRIAAAAKANNRSMNAEIIARLEGSFETEILLPRLGLAFDGLEAEIAEDRNGTNALLSFLRVQMNAFAALADIIVETEGDVPERVVDAMKQIIAARPSKKAKPA